MRMCCMATGFSSAAVRLAASSLVNSLNDVVLHLVHRSLLSHSSNIKVSVEFAQGSCTVEDNGDYISESVMRETLDTENLLGLLHAEVQTFGSKSYLAAVASLSTLHICSIDPAVGLNNVIALHFGHMSKLQVDAVAHRSVSRGKGTTIIVQDLFGNLSIRKRVVSRGAADLRIQESQWNVMYNDMIRLILSYGIWVDLELTATEEEQVLQIHSPGIAVPRKPDLQPSLARPFDISFVKNVLMQSGMIDPAQWTHWKKMSAKTDHWTIRAVFSELPHTSKHVQFVCIGAYFRSNISQMQPIYDSINRAFERSGFGADASPTRSRTHINYNGSQPTFESKEPFDHSQTVESWPMFVIRADARPNQQHTDKILAASTIESLKKVLLKLVSRYISLLGIGSKSVRQHYHSRSQDAHSTAMRALPTTSLCAAAEPHRGVSIDREPFQVRSKSGKGAITCAVSVDQAPSLPSNAIHNSIAEDSMGMFSADMNSEIAAEADKKQSEARASALETDGVIFWHDLRNQSILSIDARTGFALNNDSGKDLPQPEAIAQQGGSRLTIRRDYRHSGSSSWSNSLTDNWANPVFRLSEPQVKRYRISKTSQYLTEVSNITYNLNQEDFAAPSADCRTHVTPQNLTKAETLSQVDRKFILITIPQPLAFTVPDDTAERHTLLALVDQHAADERVQVEAVLSRFFEPSNSDSESVFKNKGVISSVDTTVLPEPARISVNSEEISIIKSHEAYFARWGISFKSDEAHVIVSTVPTVIAERCYADRELLARMVRTTAQELKDGRYGSLGAVHDSGKAKNEASAKRWLTRLHECPSGIVNMLNSLAYRRAIMFNDILSPQQCEDLIQKLKLCQLPLQCAHGRPSLVPIVDLSSPDLSDLGNTLGPDDEKDDNHFKTHFMRWIEKTDCTN